MGKQRCNRVSHPLLQPISESTSGPPRPVPAVFHPNGVRLWLALSGFGGEEDKMCGIPSPSAQHPVRHGVGVLLPWQVLRLTRVVRALQGSQGTPPDKTEGLQSPPLSTAYRSFRAGGQGNHPAPSSSLLARERGGQSSCQVF